MQVPRRNGPGTIDLFGRENDRSARQYDLSIRILLS
jgi:hypothetical protein